MFWNSSCFCYLMNSNFWACKTVSFSAAFMRKENSLAFSSLVRSSGSFAILAYFSNNANSAAFSAAFLSLSALRLFFWEECFSLCFSFFWLMNAFLQQRAFLSQHLIIFSQPLFQHLSVCPQPLFQNLIVSPQQRFSASLCDTLSARCTFCCFVANSIKDAPTIYLSQSVPKMLICLMV